MNIPIYQVDAFCNQLFGGNPAAVMLLDAWLDDALLQTIAAENNLSETAFLVARGEDYELRWFTPTVEVPLCGHATLAAAHTLFELGRVDGESVVFHTQSGALPVQRAEQGLSMSFPAKDMVSATPSAAVSSALGAEPEAVVVAGDGGDMVVYVFTDEQQVAALNPDFPALLKASEQALIVTAPGDEADFVSRFFGPQVGLDEDPVTGSAHCYLMPYWAQRLGRNSLYAKQISARGGDLYCDYDGSRVTMTGTAVTYMQGTVSLP